MMWLASPLCTKSSIRACQNAAQQYVGRLGGGNIQQDAGWLALRMTRGPLFQGQVAPSLA